MGKRICALMIFLTCFLTACAGGKNEPEELLQQVRGHYLELSACGGHAEVTADYGQRVYTYGIDFTWAREGETRLVLTAPENVAGAVAHIEAGETALEFDGVMLETGALDNAGLTPIDVLPTLLTYAREGFVSACVLEGEEGQKRLRMTCSDPEKSPGQGVEADLWFDAAAFTLLRGEMSVDGVTVIQCDVTDFMGETVEQK